MSGRTLTTTERNGFTGKEQSLPGPRPHLTSLLHTPYDDILLLQRNIGNQGVQRLFQAGAIQPKLSIGQPNDIYEQEADRLADHIMRMPDPAVQRKPG